LQPYFWPKLLRSSFRTEFQSGFQFALVSSSKDVDDREEHEDEKELKSTPGPVCMIIAAENPLCSFDRAKKDVLIVNSLSLGKKD
jgi:hypothetical protein